MITIQCAHCRSPIASGTVPRRPASFNDIVQGYSKQSNEQLHVSVPAAHKLPAAA
jgi:hypothetical protein